MADPRPVRRLLLFGAAVLAAGAFWVAVTFGQAKGKHGGRTPAPEPLSAAEAQQASALYATTCASCHGIQREGLVGPSLVDVGSRYSLSKIEKIAQRGKGRKKAVPMPAGLVSPEEARLLARWLVAGPPPAADAPASSIPR